MAKRRKRSVHGGGSVFQRKSDGCWVASIKAPESGKYMRRYAETEKEASTLQDEIKDESACSRPGSADLTARYSLPNPQGHL